MLVIGPLTARIAAVMLCSAAIGSPAGARDPRTVNTFPNAKSLPVYVGITKGFFAKYGLDRRGRAHRELAGPA